MDVKAKVDELKKDCACGLGKKAFQCCKQGEAKAIANESCPCGSGKTVGNCCMKSPETH